jgi:hypothetical protein
VVIPWAAKLKAFNSLSRDHEKITDDATAWAVWIFQLPLSGSRVRGGQKSCARQNGSTPFNSLSRDHGITANLEDASEANCAQAFQLPLSGSLPQGVLSIQQPPSFNSLSRDHREYVEHVIETQIIPNFQLPLSGSRAAALAATDGCALLAFQLPLSGSRDHDS